MNAAHKARLASLVSELEKIASAIREMQQDEQRSFDRHSGKWQGSTKGETAEEHLTTLEVSAEAIENVVSDLRVEAEGSASE